MHLLFMFSSELIREAQEHCAKEIRLYNTCLAGATTEEESLKCIAYIEPLHQCMSQLSKSH
jgi:hypothetical protein